MVTAKMRAYRDLVRDNCDDCGMRVPQNQCRMTNDIVDKLITIDVPLSRPVGGDHVRRKGLNAARIMVYASGHESDGPLEQRGGSGEFAAVSGIDRVSRLA
jgi:hypothetical protein